ncbi:helix-turn-helix domain-containing protein [Candidatus Velamenicoccus archaeovorus]|uniref:helix-turn-helix domain-containing protein n=1 Tax=Velamenicoccus archaeovorus TaxID=1930593 RepID=UPI000FFEDD9C|nr:helix-turn-helix domain-containing protein [Candidatus Velamenicoccus archaeovorus]
MSKLAKFNQNIKRFILETRKRNSDYGVRKLADLAFGKFGVKISKSTVNNIVKNAKLSKPVGRSILKTYRYSGDLYGAGYVFFVGAMRLLGIGDKVAAITSEMGLCKEIRPETIPSLVEGWLLSKAVYNVPLEKIAGYSKKELWDIIGYKISKANFETFLAHFEFSQDIGNKLVMYFLNSIKDVSFIKFTLSDGGVFHVDAKGCYVWTAKKTPVNFSSNLLFLDSYINSFVEGNEPFFVLNANPEGSTQAKELQDFILAMEGSVAEKRIRRIDLFGPDGRPCREISFVLPLRRRFVIGASPASDTEKITAPAPKSFESNFICEPLGKLFFVSEESHKVSQHIGNKDVMIRKIHLKSSDPSLRISLLTNLDPKDWTAVEIAEGYLRRFGNFQEYLLRASEWAKNPGYADEFVSADRFLAHSLRLKESKDAEHLFACLVEVCDLFAKMSFLPPLCRQWSLLKTRELIYKQPGAVQRDTACDVLFNILKTKELEKIRVLEHASLIFNSLPVNERSGRKLWIFLTAAV